MPRYILKLDEWYFEWSTIVDAPVTYRMTLNEFKEYYREEYGRQGMQDLPARLTRVEKQGTSAYPYTTADQLIQFNRAGDGETNISKELILEKYVIPEDKEA